MARRRGWLCGLALLLALLALPGDAGAAVKNTGVLSMSPARRSLTARPPVTLTPTTVANSTPSTIKVRVFTALVYQRLDGTFGVNDSPRDLNEGRLVLHVSPTRFTLAPGTSQVLRLRWQLVPRGKVAVYPGLVIQGVPQVKGEAVNTILRLLGVNFFQLPGNWPVSGRITKIRGLQAAPRVLTFLPRVRNFGRIHSQPRGGRCTITDANGAVRLRAPFGEGVILPGFAREYPITVKKILPAGSYSMRCFTRFGRTRSTRTFRFTLSGPNTLPTARLGLRSVTASGEIGGAAHVRVGIVNKGSKASPALLKVTLARVGSGGRPPRPVARGRFDEGSVGGGAGKSVSLDIGKDLVKGRYRVDVVLSDRQTDLDERARDFDAKPHRGLWTRIWDWLSDNFWILILLVLAIVVALLFWRQRRRQRELEAELERARQERMAAAPEPEPVADDSEV